MKKNIFPLISYIAQKLRQKLYYVLMALSLVISTATTSQAGVSVSIGINMPVYPQLVLVPGYPVYYDPQADANYFFYDGLYWVFQDDNWYASSWYNGPWDIVYPEDVPVFILRIPVRYYRQPPIYFGGWYAYESPHWGEHWGHDWEDRRHGWDQWDHHSAQRPAPLPVYQKQYSGNRYPNAEEQQYTIQSRHYHYKPHETVTQQHFQQQGNPNNTNTPPQRQGAQQYSPQNRSQEQRVNNPPAQQNNNHSNMNKQPEYINKADTNRPRQESQTAPQKQSQDARTQRQDTEHNSNVRHQEQRTDNQPPQQDNNRDNHTKQQDNRRDNRDEEHIQNH